MDGARTSVLHLLLSRSACSFILASSSSRLFSWYLSRKEVSSLHFSSQLLRTADASSWSLAACSFWACSSARALAVWRARKTEIDQTCIGKMENHFLFLNHCGCERRNAENPRQDQ